MYKYAFHRCWTAIAWVFNFQKGMHIYEVCSCSLGICKHNVWISLRYKTGYDALQCRSASYDKWRGLRTTPTKIYSNCPKYWDTLTNYHKICRKCDFFSTKDVINIDRRMANSADSDQTASLEAVWSPSTMFTNSSAPIFLGCYCNTQKLFTLSRRWDWSLHSESPGWY